ncbi:MAG: hypothetical protein ACTHJR_12190 [Sphingomonas sp.]
MRRRVVRPIGSERIVLDTLILVAISGALLIGAVAARTLFRWACVYYRHS